MGGFHPSPPRMRWATYRHLRAVDAALQQRWLLGKVGQISCLLVVDLVRHTLAGFVRGPSMRIKIILLMLILGGWATPYRKWASLAALPLSA